MKRRLLSLSLTLALSLLLTIPAFAELPKGFWPYLLAWQQAVASGDESAILQTGDAYLGFLAGFERNREITENQYNIYLDRLERQYYENRSDWDGAVRNTGALLDAGEYLQSIGVDRLDMIRRCETHLEVLPPVTGVYAASYTQSNRYGSKLAPASGAWYGSIAEGSLGSGSICSFYVECETETARQFDYLIAPKADGKRAILVNLNFKNEGTTAAAIPGGKYDNNLRTTLSYLNTVNGPVLLRIAGEMDVWTDAVTPEVYRAAYSHIATLARSLAPTVELVWSPNCVPSWGGSVTDYYPGDSVVDWIGMSLYYNYDANGSDNSITWVEHTRAKQFADPITVAETIFTFAKEHGKPAIATEGGLRNTHGEDYSARQTAKEFSTLTMVYPQVKAIVYFDKTHGGDDFRLTGRIKTAVQEAIAANPTLIAPGQSSAATYIPLEQYNEKPNGSLVLSATGRTYHSVDMSAVWTLDGKQLAATAASPNLCRVDAAAIASGTHTLSVTLNDGQGYTETQAFTLTGSGGTVRSAKASAPAPQPAPVDTGDATPAPAGQGAGNAAGDYFSTDIVTTVNGTPINSINVGGRTLINAEDLSGHGFTVNWDGDARTLAIQRGGSDFGGSPVSAASGKPGTRLGSYYNTDIVTSLDGTVVSAWNTGGSTWLCAEDMEALGYSVVWDGGARTLTVSE